MLLEVFDEEVVGHEAGGGTLHAVEGDDVDGLGGEFHLAVLHASAVGALVFALWLVAVGFDDAGVVLDGAVALLSGFRGCGLVESGAVVEACFHDFELIALGAVGVAEFAPHGGALEVACPELGILVDDGGDVAQGAVEVAGLVEQEGAVVEGYHIVGLLGEDEVEVLDGAVVVAELGAHESAVEVSEVVVGLDLESLVVVFHGAAEVVLMIACEGAVDVVAGVARALDDGFVDFLFGLCVGSALEADHGTHGPRLCVEGVDDECRVNEFEGADGVGLCDGDLRLHGQILGIAGPEANHLVEGGVCLGVVLQLEMAEDEVVPAGFVARLHGDDFLVVAHGALEVAEVDAT